MGKNLELELQNLEKCFLDNGYTKESIEEIKTANEAETINDYIDNLQEEQGYWDC